jgi:hypothetical protein
MGALGADPAEAARDAGHSLSSFSIKNGVRSILRVMAIIILVCLPLLILPGTAEPRALDDLDLANRLEQTQQISQDIENPHSFDCEDCHEKAGDSRFIIYIVDSDTVGLCEGCHTPSHLHPIGMAPTYDSFLMEKLELPLGRGKYKDKVVCLTCHYMHDQKYKISLLRGDKEKRISRQEYLCGSCHSDELVNRSPHDPDSKACNFCHTTVPEEGQKLSDILNENVQASCNFCHSALDNAHFLSVNPFADPEVTWRFDKVGIPLINGRFSCISCHDPHAYENRKKKMLRESYLFLAAESDHVNPHWKEVMCISCHSAEPTEGEPHLRFDGDSNILCGRCHNGRFARQDMHPVGKEPSDNVSVPVDMPLHKGQLTCSTCHDSSLQEGGEGEDSVKEDNPSFLRGGFNVRNEYCFRCHIQDQYGKMNAHAQLDFWGEVNEQSCLFCHTTPPNEKVMGIEHVKFSTENLDDYCTVCHGENMFFDNHPRGPHLVEPSLDIFEAIESATERIGVELPLYNGYVTCATCHNPHQEGIIQNDFASAGADNPKRLRLGNSIILCTGCHTDKL